MVIINGRGAHENEVEFDLGRGSEVENLLSYTYTFLFVDFILVFVVMMNGFKIHGNEGLFFYSNPKGL
jgi:hypothetical protein